MNSRHMKKLLVLYDTLLKRVPNQRLLQLAVAKRVESCLASRCAPKCIPAGHQSLVPSFISNKAYFSTCARRPTTKKHSSSIKGGSRRTINFRGSMRNTRSSIRKLEKSSKKEETKKMSDILIAPIKKVRVEYKEEVKLSKDSANCKKTNFSKLYEQSEGNTQKSLVAGQAKKDVDEPREIFAVIDKIWAQVETEARKVINEMGMDKKKFETKSEKLKDFNLKVTKLNVPNKYLSIKLEAKKNSFVEDNLSTIMKEEKLPATFKTTATKFLIPPPNKDANPKTYLHKIEENTKKNSFFTYSNKKLPGPSKNKETFINKIEDSAPRRSSIFYFIDSKKTASTNTNNKAAPKTFINKIEDQNTKKNSIFNINNKKSTLLTDTNNKTESKILINKSNSSSDIINKIDLKPAANKIKDHNAEINSIIDSIDKITTSSSEINKKKVSINKNEDKNTKKSSIFNFNAKQLPSPSDINKKTGLKPSLNQNDNQSTRSRPILTFSDMKIPSPIQRGSTKKDKTISLEDSKQKKPENKNDGPGFYYIDFYL